MESGGDKNDPDNRLTWIQEREYDNLSSEELYLKSLYWTVTTITTVGYGDVYPVTLGGRCFTFVVLLVGLGIISIPAGIVASALAKAREIEGK